MALLKVKGVAGPALVLVSCIFLFRKMWWKVTLSPSHRQVLAGHSSQSACKSEKKKDFITNEVLHS